MEFRPKRHGYQQAWYVIVFCSVQSYDENFVNFYCVTLRRNEIRFDVQAASSLTIPNSADEEVPSDLQVQNHGFQEHQQ